MCIILVPDVGNLARVQGAEWLGGDDDGGDEIVQHSVTQVLQPLVAVRHLMQHHTQTQERYQNVSKIYVLPC